MASRSRSIRCLQAFLLLGVAASLGGCQKKPPTTNPTATARASATVAAPAVHAYSTTFPRTENPLNENGTWIAGHTAGVHLWGNVQSVPGLAFGVDEPTKFGDPTAILTGAWGPAQTASATVRILQTPTGKCCHEVELRLRTTISPHSITGYEAYCSVMPNQPYCHIARWNGPDNSYWNFETGSSATYLKDGDVIKATITGTNPTIITLYKNGAQLLQATDTGAAGGGFGAYGPFTSGNPGIGFFDNADNHWKDFGLSSFSVTDRQP